MFFLISDAMAQVDAASQQSGGLLSFLPLIIIFIVFYFLLIRPQVKRQKEHKALVSKLTVGNEIVTNGGLVGKVSKIGANFADLELPSGIVIKIQKQAVATVLPKGTIANAD